MASRWLVGGVLIAAFSAAVFGRDTKPAGTAPKDQCSPEPGATAPTLPAHLMDGMGKVHFAITTRSQDAQKFFDQGVAQMHSFWAREAERSFLQAAALDPQAPMPWWGVAMVAAGDYRPGFQLNFVNGAPAESKGDRPIAAKDLKPEQKRAFEAAARAVALSEAPDAVTELEKLYIHSVAARRGIGVSTPNRSYVEGLRHIISSHPKEVEAQTYLALAIMSGFTTPERKPRPGSMEAVEILKRLLPLLPEHPGVQHYVIHGWEGSAFAREAWPSCEKYPKLAPMIPHALHMPGHIYAQTGRWDNAEEAFMEAADLERRYMSEDSLYGSGHHGHNVHFLITTYMFERDYDRAFELAHELMSIPETPGQRKQIDNWYAADRQGWFGLMRILVYSERWDQILNAKVFPVYSAPREQAWFHWARAIAYAAQGDTASTERETARMDDELKRFAKATEEDVPPPLLVAREELKAHLASSRKQDAEALDLFEKASEQEQALRYQEPPSYPRPIAELSGRLALRLGQRERAARNFRTALREYPKSPRAIEGLREAMLSGSETVAAAR